jgi:selenocysteine-specific elongation factor
MRSLIVGTAGHIDHGKSALVKALTGTDPDRLKEEKERGITVDLGFAHLDLGGGVTASFIDVPGHERFVRNMLAGAHGVDAVVLVIAADESVMPQTREHFHICRLLGVPRGLIALTKCDLAPPDLQALAELEARELAAGSFLEAAPVLRVSAQTGAGLAELRDALRALAGDVRDRPVDALLRLPVDRAFTMRGFGTVVTGTLVSGALETGQELELLPAGRRVRVRGLQVHGAPAPRVTAGSRAAVNLSGVEVSEVARGDVLAQPGTLRPTALLDVEIALLPGQRALRNQARLRVHLASAEVLARLHVIGGGAVEAGRLGRGQLRLERPAVAGRGDRVILRSYSPATTIGGALVLDPLPPRRRRRDALAVVAEADRRQAALAMIAESGVRGVEAGTLAARLTITRDELRALLEGETGVAAVGRDPAFLSRKALDELGAATETLLARFHADHPLRPSMPREELRTRAFTGAPEGAFARVLADLEAAGRARALGDGVALARHEIRLSAPEQEARRALLAAGEAAGLEGVEPPRLAASGLPAAVLEGVARLLVTEGALRRVGDALVFAPALDRLKDDLRRRHPPGSRLDVGALKEMTGLSRKFVIPLLEYLDRERVTRRSGNDRVVLESA